MLAGGDLLAGDLLDRRIKAGTVSPARSLAARRRVALI